jgi:metal-dependent amidase/aminoacylase/carboxypeptidase family protein
MASTDEIYITFNGKGGHAAIKRERSDTVLATAEFIVEVQKAFSQIEIPGLPSILAFGKLKADGAVNIVPDTSIAHGTLRCFDENLRKSAKMHIKNIADTCATKYKCTADVNIIDGYPHLHNNEKSTKLAAQFTADLLGSQAVIPLDLRLTAEDFAYYSHQVPSVFYRMGITGNNKGENSLHASNFDLDEIALKTTPAVMAWLAYNFTKA